MITQILQTSRRKNKEQNVTGALLFDSGYFAQTLEGPRLAIERTFERSNAIRDMGMSRCSAVKPTAAEISLNGRWLMLPLQAECLRYGCYCSRYVFVAPTASAEEVLGLLRSLVIQEDRCSAVAGHPIDVRGAPSDGIQQPLVEFRTVAAGQVTRALRAQARSTQSSKG